MSMEQLVRIDGPKHPDLFGGETPMSLMVPVSDALKAYDVDLRARSSRSIRIVATSMKEAEKIALQKADSGIFDDPEWEVDLTSVDEHSPPTQQEIDEFTRRSRANEH